MNSKDSMPRCLLGILNTEYMKQGDYRPNSNYQKYTLPSSLNWYDFNPPGVFKQRFQF